MATLKSSPSKEASAMASGASGKPSGRPIGVGEAEPGWATGNLGVDVPTGGRSLVDARPPRNSEQPAAGGTYEAGPAPTFVQANANATGPVTPELGEDGAGADQCSDGMNRP